MSPAGVYFILFLAVLARVHSESWTEETCDSKYDECEDLMSAPDPPDEEERCHHYNQTIRCFDVYFEENCIGQALYARFARNTTIKTKYCPDCSPGPLEGCIESFFSPVSTPSPSVTPPPPGCSYSPPLHLLPPFTSPPLPELGSPSLSHRPPSTECSLPTHETHYKQHCSIFSLSHLRPFSDRSLPLQTCILYGSVYLIKHKNMSVSVSGAIKTGTVGYYTHITEVNVTLHGCSPGSSFHYRATVTGLPQPLPSPGVHVSVNETVATISAPGINSTIIIHQMEGHLSVSLQVPEPLTRPNEVTGLCSEGCSQGFRVEDSDLSLPDYTCPENRAGASIMCLSLGLSMPPVGRVTYSQLCLYDILVTHDVANLLSLYSALDEDVRLLPDVTEIIITPAGLTPETTASSKKPQAVSSVVIMPPTDDGLASQSVSSAHPFFPITLISLLLPLFIR